MHSEICPANDSERRSERHHPSRGSGRDSPRASSAKRTCTEAARNSTLTTQSYGWILTETEQALRVEARDFLSIIRVDRHLIKELPSGFHAAVWMVRGEQDAVDADRVRHGQIGLVRQTP